MSGSMNALLPPPLDPIDQGPANALLKPADSVDFADAYTSSVNALSGYMAKQRAEGVANGFTDPVTGWPTQAGILNAVRQYGWALVAGTSAPGRPATVPGIRGYHGSPHDFDAFDASKIGSGEGNQAYGHGLYFAENEGVAKGYRDQLAGKSGPAYEAAAREFGDAHYNFDGSPEALARVEAATTALSEAEKANPGHMYEININANPDHFLDWDKPLSEQSQHVRDAIANSPLSGYEKTNLPGSQIVPHTVEGAQALASYGIPGIRYLDQNSRHVASLKITPPSHTVAGDWMVKGNDYNSSGMHFATEADAQAALAAEQAKATSNHVVFDPATIEILRKYGIAGLMAGGAAASTQTPPTQ